jgi:hypothetical protein
VREGTGVTSVGPPLTLAVSVAEELTTVVVGVTDTTSTVSPIGVDALIGIPGDGVIISRDSPLVVVALMGVRIDIAFGGSVEVGINTGAVIVVAKAVEVEVAGLELVVVVVVDKTSRVKSAGSTRASGLLVGSAPSMMLGALSAIKTGELTSEERIG